MLCQTLWSQLLLDIVGHVPRHLVVDQVTDFIQIKGVSNAPLSSLVNHLSLCDSFALCFNGLDCWMYMTVILLYYIVKIQN